MESTRIERLKKYLLGLAPEFFAAGIAPASEADLARLEAASGRRVVGYHREFLLAMGNTGPGALDPFLNGRAFNVEALIAAYPDLADLELSLPADISVFSAPESFAEFEFVRTRVAAATVQEAGTLNFETTEFSPEDIGTLEDYILKSAFSFRVGQLEHVQTFVPRTRWAPDACVRVLEDRGMSRVFQFPNGTICHEGGPFAGMVFNDGSGHVASDDRVALLTLCGALEDLADVRIEARPRLPAPKR